MTEAKVVTEVLATDAGKELFRFLFKVCGYDQTSIVVDARTGAIDDRKSLYNEARRAVYIQLRTLALSGASAEALKEIEFTVPVSVSEVKKATEEKK